MIDNVRENQLLRERLARLKMSRIELIFSGRKEKHGKIARIVHCLRSQAELPKTPRQLSVLNKIVQK